ncbi:SAF domain-containing protein [Mahella australiensis]|uniref:SAF domain protein n=1 Tax=Mahella australiensis (strain DSM 15567 / CIP 107919 / 50-1 BON) TaxID=697281 RepID=F3ZWU3_MAHA5|nr:SAF domain-containing protein [Mahella australiensis]AEE97565.1 hypothetical protein Mahau_2401 [Mahella australiensis 50-1 BON]
MNRIIKIAIAAAVIIFVAAYLFTYNTEGTKQVVVVTKEINDTMEITSDMITVKALPVSAVPGDVLTDPNAVIGKMTTVGRIPGDLIPKSILAKPEDIAVKDNEVLLTMNIPSSDDVLTHINKKILLALYGDQKQPPIIVDGVEIYQIKNTVSGSSGQSQPYAIIKTDVETAKIIMPYIASGSYKILSNKGQSLPSESAADQEPAGQNTTGALSAVNSIAKISEYRDMISAKYKELENAYAAQQKTKNINSWKSWSETWQKDLNTKRNSFETLKYDSSVNPAFQQAKAAADAVNRLWAGYNAVIVNNDKTVDIAGAKADYQKYITAVTNLIAE